MQKKLAYLLVACPKRHKFSEQIHVCIFISIHSCLKQEQITKTMVSFEKCAETFVLFEAVA